jgi:cyclopropane-fatty-acyl-phospholipid synthase
VVPPLALPFLAVIDFLLAQNVLPDWLIRLGIRRLLRQRLRDEAARYDADRYVADLRQRPIAESTAEANAQHYEVPAAFFQHCLGPRLKYSSCLYPTSDTTLAAAEEAMLALYVERAQLEDGQDILELGCGWGSFTLYLAERFPHSRIIGVSNSASQRRHIEEQAQRRRLRNVHILTCDMNDARFDPAQFDRVVSIEMFEHMKNYEVLLGRIADWLRPGGQLFVHIFTHARYSYHFESTGPGDWMARHFFTGGQMPAHDLLPRFQGPLQLEADWQLPGFHYQRTAEDWLQNMDQARYSILPLLAATYGEANTRRWWVYWRVFFMSCAELWGYEGGREWLVSHYRFRRP